MARALPASTAARSAADRPERSCAGAAIRPGSTPGHGRRGPTGGRANRASGPLHRWSHPPLDVLDLQVFSYAPFAELTADAGAAVAAARRVRAHGATAVDPHRAGPDLLGDPPALGQVVAAPDVGGQPVRRVVGQPDRLVGVLERQAYRHPAG